MDHAAKSAVRLVDDALIDFDFSLTRPEKLRRKYDMLDIGEQH